MYLYLGQETVVSMREVVGIFDMDNTTISKSTRDFLAAAERNGQVTAVSNELPKSFVVCASKKQSKQVYISQISCPTLVKRANAMCKIEK